MLGNKDLKNFRTISPLRDSVWVGSLFFVACLISTLLLLAAFERVYSDSVHRKLEELGLTVSQFVDSSLHRQLQRPGLESSVEYARAIEPLRRIHRVVPGVKFIYTMVQKDGQIRFVLDDTPPGDRDRDGVEDQAKILEPYAEAGATLKEVFRTGKAAVTPKPYRDKWGSFLSGYAPILGDDGSLEGVVGVDLDQSSYERQIAGLRNKAYSLLAVMAALTLALSLLIYFERTRVKKRLASAFLAAESANRAKDDFLRNISHEVRTPLNAVNGFSALLLKTRLDPRQKDYAKTVYESGELLLSIVGDLIDVSRIESGNLAFVETEFSLQNLVESVVFLLGPKKRQNVALSFDYDKSLPPYFLADAPKIKRVLINVVGNALKYTSEGSVRVDVRKLPPTERQSVEMTWVRFVVADTGIGMQPKDTERIFDVFSSLDQSRSGDHTGIGLGLSITKKIVDGMGGFVRVESEFGKGSRFTIDIPMKSGGPADPSEPKRRSESPFAGKSAIILDDEDSARKLIEAFCIENGINVLLKADNCQEAIAWLSKNREVPDYIFCDSMLPEMSGHEFARWVRAKPKYGAVKLVDVTGSKEGEAITRARESGFNGFVAKPFQFGRLSDVLGQIESAGEAAFVSTEPPAGRFSGKRILCVDDNPVNRKLVNILLKSIGCEVDLAEDGVQAVRVAEENGYDACFMDLDMPFMNGLEATRIIRQKGIGFPIIALTASTIKGDEIRCYEAGMNDFLMKPVQVQDLEKCLKKYL